MSDSFTRLLGDTPGRLIFKLVIVSIVTGFVMKAIGIYPLDIYYHIRDFFVELWRTGFAAFGELGQYFLLGAMVVIPFFVVIRILSYRR